LNAILYWCTYIFVKENEEAERKYVKEISLTLYSTATLSLIPGVIMMMTYYMLHLLLIDQIQQAYTDRATTY
jgi:flagellar biosynthesis protein FliP